MPDPCLSQANQLIAEASSLPASEAVRFLFDRYRTALPDWRDEIVLALIGAVVVSQRRPGAQPQSEAVR